MSSTEIPPHRSESLLAASGSDSCDFIFSPRRSSASGMLGVITRTCGMSSSRSVATASASSRGSPEVATITGSSTMFFIGYRARVWRTARMSSLECSMPILIASAPMSSSTERIWPVTKSTGMGWTPVTPTVFSSTTATTAEAP